MNTYLIAAIFCAGLALFNLYCFFQQGSETLLILFVGWAIMTYRNFKRYKAEKD